MKTFPIRDKIPSLFVEKIKNMLPIEKIILFGSMVAKTDRLDSDIDIALIGNKERLSFRERDKINEVVTDIILDFEVFINWIYINKKEYKNISIPIVKSIKEEGMKLWEKEKTL